MELIKPYYGAQARFYDGLVPKLHAYMAEVRAGHFAVVDTILASLTHEQRVKFARTIRETAEYDPTMQEWLLEWQDRDGGQHEL